MDRTGILYESFKAHLDYELTSDQDAMLRRCASFLLSDEGDILVVNGFAGTGKTTAIAAVVEALAEMKIKSVLLAPTGRAAKVLSSYTGRQAYTIHKHIYRQRSVGEDGFGQFSLSPNKSRDTLYVVDEVSLMGIEQGSSSQGAVFGTGNLIEDLIRFVRSGTGCRLIMMGDSAQLPPVGLDRSPALSPEYMGMAGGVSFVTLREVVRQKEDSGILRCATRLRMLIEEGSGEMPRTGLHLPLDGPGIGRLDGGGLIDAITSAYEHYGQDETVVLCRSNRRANRYNAGIRAQVLYHEEQLVRGEKLMIVKNCYQFVDKVEDMDYIANGDIADLVRISNYEERYGLQFADARLSFPDYGGQEIVAKVCLDTLSSEAASLSYEQQNALYRGVDEDYAHITAKKKRYEAVREDPFYNALQLKYANAITGHKSQGGQWSCVFVDNPFWQDELTLDDLKWLYTAVTRGVDQVWLVNFKDDCFD